MTREPRAGVACLLVGLLGLPVWAQDPIDIDEDPNDSYIEAEAVGGSRRPGRSMQLRNDVKNERYKMFANLGSGDVEVTRVEFTVLAIGPQGTNVDKIERQADGTLEFRINDTIVADGCNPHVAPPAGCVGSGMPAELYGNRASGTQFKAFNAEHPDGVVVSKVKLRYDPEE